MKVLIIDSHPESMKYWSYALEKAGIEFLQVTDVDMAFQHINSSAWDCVVFDMVLPPGKRYARNPESMEGWATGLLLARDLRELRPDMPLVCFSDSPPEDLCPGIADPALDVVAAWKAKLIPSQFPWFLRGILMER